MSGLVQEFLLSWESELLQLRANDPLTNLSPNAFIDSETDLWNDHPIGRQILKEHKRIERERGVIALVQFEGLLTWKRGEQLMRTPVFLMECTALNQQTQKLAFENAPFLNPFISLHLKKSLDIELGQQDPQTTISTLLATGIFTAYEPTSGLANLHPQRYELRKEWEALRKTASYSSALHQIIGDIESAESGQTLPWQNTQLSPLDPDQKAALNQIGESSVVVYGPPGTGKSVVLSNAIGRSLYNGQTVLVVSDKPVALEVLVGKLAQHELDQYCVFLQDNQTTQHFYKKLQLQFERLLQTSLTKETWDFGYRYLGAEFWQQRNQIENETGFRLNEILKLFGQPKKAAKKHTKRWQVWLKQQNLLEQLQPELRKILPMLQSYWQEAIMLDLQKDWLQWQELLDKLQKDQPVVNFEELELLVEQSLRCIQFEGNIFQTYKSLLDQDPSTELKKLYQFQQLCTQQQQLLEQLQVWKQVPTTAEWEVLKIASQATRWLDKRKWRKLESYWLRLPGLQLKPLESSLKKYWQNQIQIAKIKERFIGLGVQNLEENQSLLIALLRQHNKTNWQWYRQLNQRKVSELCSVHHSAHLLKQLHQKLFTKQVQDFEHLKTAIVLASPLSSEVLEQLRKLPFELWENAADNQQLKANIIEEFWADLRLHYPALFRISDEQFRNLIHEDLKLEQVHWSQTALQIRKAQQQKFSALQQLLEAPLNKLTAEQKEQRQTLRKGKAILVKEMAKTRQHANIASLYDGPAAAWLEVVFPVWLSTPTTLAKVLPMQTELFNFGIFDEASQLPLSHAVGALQRVSKIVVAGDPQQMRPQSYFGQSAEGVVDLLHQAAFYLPRKNLRYHYRSEAPSLIAFSNLHFYDNALLAWPAFGNPSNGLFDHYIEKGRYEQQQNIEEARTLAKALRGQLNNQQKIGVVAFSEAQLNCIYQQLSSTEQLLLDQRIQDRTAFFLALEQVQGEECENLYISFGYAKNETEQFSLKIGPMAQAQSGRRLNVLLTRAQKSLHFYSSIRAADFPSKRSAATNKLWEWFVFLENNVAKQAAHDAKERLDAAPEYLTFLNYYRVLQQRQALPDQV
jgi:hypothetical protein